MNFKYKTKNQLKNELEAAENNFKNIEWVAKEWRNLFDSITDFVSLHDKDFRIVRANKALADYVGVKPVELIGEQCHEVFHSLEKPIMGCLHAETMKLKKTVTKEFYEPKLDSYLMFVTSPVFDEEGDLKGSVHIVKNITDRKQAEKKRERLVLELREALHRVKTLSGLLLICSGCKKIRDDKGYWNQIEVYISDHSQAEFSHGMCPECAKKFFPT
jgi:PAS domain S-box-containing protein